MLICKGGDDIKRRGDGMFSGREEGTKNIYKMKEMFR